MVPESNLNLRMLAPECEDTALAVAILQGSQIPKTPPTPTGRPCFAS